MRELITMACQECKRRNYNYTRDKKNQKEKMELKKYCSTCRKHTPHKEIK